MLAFVKNRSTRASRRSQGLPSSNNENLEAGADGVTEVSQGPDDRKPRRYSFFSSKKERRFWEKNIGHDGTSSSQPSSPRIENPDESKMAKIAPSRGADGKTTFKPKDLSIGMEEESQSWRISERDGSAELLEACWLDVTGSKTAIKGKTYEISFKLSMNEEKSFGWYDPVSVMAKIGEEGEYKCVKVDLSQLGKDEKVFPLEKFEIEFKSDDNTVNDETKLYFGLYEVWTNEWKGGLRIHEVIVQEVTAEVSASTSNTRPEESEVVELTADNSTSTSNNPTVKSIIQQVTAPGSASTSDNHLDDFVDESYEDGLEDEYWYAHRKQQGRKFRWKSTHNKGRK